MTAVEDRPGAGQAHEVELTTVVLASSWDVLRYLGEPANLPDFLPGVISARWDRAPSILVTVKTDDGPRDVSARMVVDEAAHTLEWALGSSAYRGVLRIEGGSSVTQVRATVMSRETVTEADHQQLQHVLGCLRHQIETSSYGSPTSR